jgi:hypothetical protein
MNEDKLIAPWKRELFDEIMLNMDKASASKQSAVLDGYHQAGQHLAMDGNEIFLSQRNPERPMAKKRTMTEAEIREWAEYFVIGYIGRVRLAEGKLEDGNDKAQSIT